MFRTFNYCFHPYKIVQMLLFYSFNFVFIHNLIHTVLYHWLKKQLNMFKSRTFVPGVTLDVNIA